MWRQEEDNVIILKLLRKGGKTGSLMPRWCLFVLEQWFIWFIRSLCWYDDSWDYVGSTEWIRRDLKWISYDLWKNSKPDKTNFRRRHILLLVFIPPESHLHFTTSLPFGRHEIQYLPFKYVEGIKKEPVWHFIYHIKQTLYLENKCDAEQTICFSPTFCVVCCHCWVAEKTAGIGTGS